MIMVMIAERSEASEDELRLYCWIFYCNQPLSLDHAALVLSLFLDFTAVNLSFYFVAFYISVISSRVPPARAAIISLILQ
jgi:hypothetical protein